MLIRLTKHKLFRVLIQTKSVYLHQIEFGLEDIGLGRDFCCCSLQVASHNTMPIKMMDALRQPITNLSIVFVSKKCLPNDIV